MSYNWVRPVGPMLGLCWCWAKSGVHNRTRRFPPNAFRQMLWIQRAQGRTLLSLSPCWGYVGPYVEPMLGQESRSKRTHLFGAMLGLCGTYVGPMLSYVGPCVGLLLFQERGARLNLDLRVSMNPQFWDHVGAMLCICWALLGVYWKAKYEGLGSRSELVIFFLTWQHASFPRHMYTPCLNGILAIVIHIIHIYCFFGFSSQPCLSHAVPSTLGPFNVSYSTLTF